MARTVAALFAGVGGIEHGFSRANVGLKLELLCESWDPARAVLVDRLKVRLGDIASDVRHLRSLPTGTDVVTAGFPCTDLSQAGRTAGIHGSQSRLVAEVFRLLRSAKRRSNLPGWVVIE